MCKLFTSKASLISSTLLICCMQNRNWYVTVVHIGILCCLNAYGVASLYMLLRKYTQSWLIKIKILRIFMANLNGQIFIYLHFESSTQKLLLTNMDNVWWSVEIVTNAMATELWHYSVSSSLCMLAEKYSSKG